MRAWRTAAAAGVGALALTGCWRDTWESFAYPNRNDLTRHVALGEFSTLEACRAAATAYLRGALATDRGDYECGLNCKASGSGGPKVCERTER
jgi:hypothetical protein